MTSCFYCCYFCDILPLGHYLLRGLVVVVTLFIFVGGGEDNGDDVVAAAANLTLYF